MEAAQQSGGAVPAAAWNHTGLGNLLREWNRLDEAARHLGRGLELAQRWQVGTVLCNSYVFLARLRQAQGDLGWRLGYDSTGGVPSTERISLLFEVNR